MSDSGFDWRVNGGNPCTSLDYNQGGNFHHIQRGKDRLATPPISNLLLQTETKISLLKGLYSTYLRL